MPSAGIRAVFAILLILGVGGCSETSDATTAPRLTASELAEHLGLDGHVEGGFFGERTPRITRC